MQVVNWTGDSGDGVYIGGGDPKDTNHSSLRTMTFAFSFSTKSIKSFETKEEEYQQKSDIEIIKDDSDNDSDETKEGYSFEGRQGSDTIYLGFGGEEGEEDNCEAEDGSDDAPRKHHISSNSGDDTIVIGSSEDEYDETNSDITDSPAIGNDDGENTISFGPVGNSEQQVLDGYQNDSEFSDRGGEKFEKIINGLQIDEVDAVTYIDNWNYDAVNWYTKSDQLSVQNALENQIIAIDAFGF